MFSLCLQKCCIIYAIKMSGSEDEAEFASADEGEPETSKQKPVAQKGLLETTTLSCLRHV